MWWHCRLISISVSHVIFQPTFTLCHSVQRLCSFIAITSKKRRHQGKFALLWLLSRNIDCIFRWQEWDWNLTFSEFNQGILRIADLKLANSQVQTGDAAVCLFFSNWPTTRRKRFKCVWICSWKLSLSRNICLLRFWILFISCVKKIEREYSSNRICSSIKTNLLLPELQKIILEF